MQQKLCTTIYLLCLSSVLFGSTFYLDPNNGNLSNDGSINAPWPSLEEVVNAGYIHTQRYNLPYDAQTSVLTEINVDGPIKAGDTLMLLSGLHGTFFVTNAHNADVITIKSAINHTPVLNEVRIRSGSNWYFEGIEISSEPYGEYFTSNMIFLESHGWQGPVHHIKIRDCYLYSTQDAKAWTIDDWLSKVRSGIRINADHVEVENCYLKNVNFGISMVGDSIKILNNVVENFAGDGLRALGPNMLIEGNTIKNCYKINDNHDDGIQSFNLGTYDTRNIIIRGNKILNYEDPDQPLLGTLQGIGCFDGPFTNWIVENNVISVNHWHGLSLYGAYNCLIRNNTAIDPTPDVTPGPSWIRVNPLKDGTPSADNVVVNNISNTLSLNGSTETHNLFLPTIESYDSMFTDFNIYDFTLISTAKAIDQGLDSLASTLDFNGVIRPQGNASDIGAFEFIFPSSTNITKEDVLTIYPNPVKESLNVNANGKFLIVDILGKTQISGEVRHHSIDVSNLVPGSYILLIEKVGVIKFIKI